MFEITHETDPLALLFMNDFNVVETGGDLNSSASVYASRMKDVEEGRVTTDDVGLEGHFTTLNPPLIRGVLDQLATLQLPIWLTEAKTCIVHRFRRDLPERVPASVNLGNRVTDNVNPDFEGQISQNLILNSVDNGNSVVHDNIGGEKVNVCLVKEVLGMSSGMETMAENADEIAKCTVSDSTNKCSANESGIIDSSKAKSDDAKNAKSSVKVTGSNENKYDNKLIQIPTEIDNDRNELVIYKIKTSK
ncbi:endo-1,4-beta-xylanase 5 [Tanacetum coccineum]